MNSKFIVLVVLLSASSVSAQLAITPGAQFSIGGNTQLTLHNTDLINDGNFSPGSSMISFTGNAQSVIAGSQPIEFNQLEIDKIINNQVLLRKEISVTQRILFTSGFLGLSGKIIDLGTTGHLDGEREGSCIFDILGGQVWFNAILNSPAAVNPGNLGVFITSNQNLGNIRLKRGHYLDVINNGASISILRYYDVLPVVHPNLDATLRFTYFDSELNGLAENTLRLFQSQNNVNWMDVGFTSKNNTTNFIEKTGISSFGKFTLSNANIPLAIQFILFTIKCDGDRTAINWKTAREQASSHFVVERSTDGIRFLAIENLPAAGYSTTEKSYSFTDNNPVQNAFYRIAAHDLNGGVQYSKMLSSSCSTTDVFSLWPNPVRDKVFINIIANTGSPATIKLFNGKGALVKMQKATLLQGSNQLSIDMRYLANGIYHLSAVWNSGQLQKTVQVVKQ